MTPHLRQNASLYSIGIALLALLLAAGAPVFAAGNVSARLEAVEREVQGPPGLRECLGRLDVSLRSIDGRLERIEDATGALP